MASFVALDEKETDGMLKELENLLEVIHDIL